MAEVVKLLAQEGDLEAEKLEEESSWAFRIPEGVREVIGRRLDRLSEGCNEVLTAGAVLGREFGLEQVNAVVESLSGEEIVKVLDEAAGSGIMEEVANEAGSYQFTHALIQETLLEELTIARRVRLHGKIALALEELYGDRADEHAAELATHLSNAEAVSSKGKLAHYCLVAGEKALASNAYEDAKDFFERGIAVKGNQATDVETADMLFGLGKASLTMFKDISIGGFPYPYVIEYFARAFNLYEGNKLFDKAIEVASFRKSLISTWSAPGTYGTRPQICRIQLPQ